MTHTVITGTGTRPAAPSDIPGETRALIRLALPILAIALVNMGMSVTDTLMVSAAFGAEALAAVAVGSDLYSILFYLGAGTIGGIAPFYTAAVTRADPAERARLERTGRIVVLLLALALVPALWTAPEWLCLLGLDPALLDEGRGYTRAMALTLVLMLGVVLYRTMLTAAERPKLFLKVTAAMLPLNALGNHLFMHGAGPIPALGPTGAGVSSLVVALASLGVLMLISRGMAGDDRRVGAARPTRQADILAVLRVGLPIGIATVAETGVFLGATLYAATLGAADVAAHTLTLRMAGVAYAVPTALLQAAMVRMARAETLDDPVLGRNVLAGALGLSVLAGLLLLSVIAAAAAPVSERFFDAGATGREAAGLAYALLLLLAAMEFLVNPGSAAAGLLRGQKDTPAPMLMTLAGYWLVGAPLGLWLCEARDMGIIGIWTGLAAGTATTAAMVLARLAAGRARGRDRGHGATTLKHVGAVTMLPQGAGARRGRFGPQSAS